MKLFKKMRKGFTLIELVVVIAVIAVLSAVAIASYLSVTNRAKQSNDQQKVDQVNLSLAANEISAKPETMYDALQSVKEDGFLPENFKAEAKNYTFAYKMSENRFVIVQNNKVVYPKSISEPESKTDLWFFADNGNNLNDGRSYYLRGNITTDVTVSGGLDVGENEHIQTVTYTATSQQSVVIRTNGARLIVNDRNTNGKVYHYGSVIEAEVTTDNNCFISHGQIAQMTLKAGKVVASKNGVIALIKAQPISGATVEATKEQNGILYIPDGTSSSDVELSESNLTALGYELSGTPGSEVINATAEAIVNNRYTIGTAQELLRYRDNWNRGAINVVLPVALTNDIDISGIQWAPMGNWEFPFHGTILGEGHTIKGLTATQSLGTDGVYAVGSTIGFGETFGFIGIAGNGALSIDRLTLDEININLTNGKNVGGLVGYVPDLAKFKSDGATYAGGKWNDSTTVSANTLSFTNITVKGSIQGHQHVGGTVGKLYGGTTATFENINNYANVTSVKDNASGIVGYRHYETTSITFKNCHNYGNIFAGASSATALIGVGSNTGVEILTIYKNCSTTATVTLTGIGTNSLGSFNSDKTALTYVAHKAAGPDLVGEYLVGGPSLGSGNQPTLED